MGAFYTPEPVAAALLRWAIRKSTDRVFDPSCGEGVFLQAAVARLADLGGESNQVFGAELDPQISSTRLIPLAKRYQIPIGNIRNSDFFDLHPESFRTFDAVVGNPPFIRYQTFKGAIRRKALARAASLGVKLPELSSSWAPFIVHASQFISAGGRLAMVVPAEVTHAGYARPVVQFLASRFEYINLASFAERIFPELSQDTLLLLAEGYGKRCKEFRARRFANVRELVGRLGSGGSLGTKVSLGKLQTSNGRLRSHLLPPAVGSLYESIAGGGVVCRLASIASVGIGYVTGNNRFFHLSESEVAEHGIPASYLRPALLRNSAIRTIEILPRDWKALGAKGEKVFLLSIPRVETNRLLGGLRRYLARGEREGIHEAYKCSVRDPWYSVPHAEPADAFLTYMSGEGPRIAWNKASLLATNSLHEVRCKAGERCDAWKLALAFCSSLSQLSSEIEGHPMGGGMLKLEPSEAERVLVAQPKKLRVSQAEFDELDSFVREGQMAVAVDLADDIVLRRNLGLTWDQIQVLREGLVTVREMRRKKLAS